MMTYFLRTFAALLIVVTSGVATGRAAQVYDQQTLSRWQDRYQRSTQRIFDEVVVPAMSVAEERRLGRVPPIEFPLRPRGDMIRHPLAFYASGGVISMPIASLKFLDDLCTAYAWLTVNGYSLETVSEYTAILRFGKPPQGGFPPPLEALGIPANALDDSRVDDLALGHFVTARAFLLAHELAHVLYRHDPRTRERSRRNEAEADRFAFQLMQRTPLPPKGALLFFMADAHWSYMASNPEATHPMSGARVASAAAHVDDPVLAGQLVQLGRFLDDPDIRQGFIATGKAGDLAALAPRRPGELARRSDTTGHGGSQAFNGLYRGHFTQAPEPDRIPVEVSFKRTGDRVTGWYNFGLGHGRINGRVEGDRLVFSWQWAGNSGRGVLRARSAGEFEGTWGYRNASSGAGVWFGQR